MFGTYAAGLEADQGREGWEEGGGLVVWVVAVAQEAESWAPPKAQESASAAESPGAGRSSFQGARARRQSGSKRDAWCLMLDSV